MTTRPDLPQSSYDFANPAEFAACVRLFLAAHPTRHTESQAVAQATGIDQEWLSPAGMVQFVDWARTQRYISSAEARWALACMREFSQAHAPQRPPHADSAIG